MIERKAGSIKNKVVATDLLEERDNLDFNQRDLTVLL